MARGIMSLLAGLGTGYNSGTQQQFENDRKKALDQVVLDRAARDSTEFNQAQADRSEFRAAGAPLAATPDTVTDADGNLVRRVVKPDTMDNADVGQPGEAPVTTPAMRVGSQGGLVTPMQTQAAVAASATPDAVRARQLAVLNKQNPMAAVQLSAADLRAQADTLEMSQQKFDSQLQDAAKGGWDSLGKFMDDSASSPSKGKWVASPDGKKMRAYQQDASSGALVPTGVEFDNDASGLANAAQFFSKRVPITAKVAHYDAEKKSALEAKKAESEITYQGRMGQAAMQNADTNEAYRRQMGDAATTRAAGAGSGKRADNFEPKEWDSIYGKSDPSITGWDAGDGSKPQQDGTLLTLRRRLLGEARQSGAAGPSEAGAQADEIILGLKQKAQAISEASQRSDKKVTPQQALQGLMANLNAPPPARPTPAAAPAPAARPTPMQTAAGSAQPAPTSTTPVSSAPVNIPPPPDPMKRQVGINMVPTNHDYVAWEKQFGQAWRDQQAATSAVVTPDSERARRAAWGR